MSRNSEKPAGRTGGWVSKGIQCALRKAIFQRLDKRHVLDSGGFALGGGAAVLINFTQVCNGALPAAFSRGVLVALLP
jgi:hypothetical protein